MVQSFATIAIPFDSDCARAVDGQLTALGDEILDDLSGRRPSDLQRRLDETGILHFMSMTIVPDTRPGQSHLMLEISADGSTKAALSAVARAIGGELERTLRFADVEFGKMPLDRFLHANNRTLGQGWFSTLGLAFSGSPGMTVPRIRKEARLAEQIANMDDILLGGASPREKLRAVRERLWNAGAEKWAFVAEPTPSQAPQRSLTPTIGAQFFGSATITLLWPLVPLVALLMWAFGAGRGLAISVAAAAAATAAAAWWLRRLEGTDVPDDTPPTGEEVGAIMKRENRCAQNLLVTVSEMKPGGFRRLALRLVFWSLGEGAARLWAPGFLGPLRNIHFARWMLLPGTGKLVFWSNYDGSWESYLENFVEEAAVGVTGVWSNTEGFPHARWLVNGGAADGDRFRRHARGQQIPTQFWYSGYPKYTMARVRLNAALRQGLASARTQAEAADWLACFGSAPRPMSLMAKDQVPTLVFGALRGLRYAACLVLRLSERVEDGRT